MKRPIVLAVICSLISFEYASACGGGGGFNSGGKIARGSFAGGGIAFVPNVNPINQGIAMQQSRLDRARQVAMAQAAAYHARMQPIRSANANRVRQERLAQREARKEIRIAKLEAKRQQEKIFLAKARTWTDVTGTHQVVAILADANAWGVKLQKQDGSTVNVPMQRLSSPDQSVVAAVLARGIENGVMLAGL